MSQSTRIVVLDRDEQAAAALAARLVSAGGQHAALTGTTGLDGLCAELAANEQDVVVLGCIDAEVGTLKALATVRRRWPNLPIVATLGGAAAPREPLLLAPDIAVVDAAVDSEACADAVAQLKVTVAKEAEDRISSRRREMGRLRAACGPAPLTASSHALGGDLLRDAARDQFQALAEDYGDLLDGALVEQTRARDSGFAEALQAMADRLGALNAGPRDVIELHRLAIASLLEDHSARKTRAYIDEGRLVLVQLMGYLMSYYRSLSWGTLHPAKRRRDP